MSIQPHLAIIIVWSVVYNLLGYGTYGADLYIDPLREPVAPSLAFVVWGDSGYVPFDRPEIGDTATVDIDQWSIVRALNQ